MHCNEVQDLNHAFERDLDVGRLQIAMHDVLFVGGFDPVDQLLNDGHRFVERPRFLPHSPPKIKDLYG